MKIVLSIILVMFLSGCCSIQKENTTNDLFLKKYLPRLEIYVMNDKNLSVRTKNTFLVEYNVYLNNQIQKR